ncbi:MAG TPA: hypothetical protein VIJ51_17455 [Solirubrobacteraceae bacterium]
MLERLRRNALSLTELDAEQIDFLGAAYGRDLIHRCLESAWRSRLIAPCDRREAQELFGINETVWALTHLGRREPTSLGSIVSAFGSRAGVAVTVAAAASTVLGASVSGLPVSGLVTAAIGFAAIYAGLLGVLYRIHRDGASPARLARESLWLWGERQTARDRAVAELEFLGRVIPGFVVVGLLDAQSAVWPYPSRVVDGLSLLAYAAVGTWLVAAWRRLRRATEKDKRAKAGRGRDPVGEQAASRAAPRERQGLSGPAR